MATLFHVQQMPNDQLNFQLKGDPRTVARMIRAVMEEKPEIASLIMAPAFDYCHDHNISIEEMQQIAEVTKLKH